MEKEITLTEEKWHENANEETLGILLSTCLGEARGQKERHDTSRTPIKRAGRKTVAFANNFSSFFQAYSGIVEKMKGADQQYGGIAYGTLSMLLIFRILLRSLDKANMIR